MRVPFKTDADIIGQVTDIDGNIHWCNRTRDSGHGFYLWYGWREDQRNGASRLVFTQELYDHLKACEFRQSRARLPLCGNIFARLRRQVGIVDCRSKAYRDWKARTAPPVLILKDIDGKKFRVVKKTETELGVPLYQGSPLDQSGNGRGIILTPTLAAVLKEWEHDRGTLAKLLGLSSNAVGDLRTRLGIDHSNAQHQWWAERLQDLLTLPSAEFAEKHGRFSPQTVNREKVFVRKVLRVLLEPEEHEETIQILRTDAGRRRNSRKSSRRQERNETLIRMRRAYATLATAETLGTLAQIPFGTKLERDKLREFYK